MRPAHYASQATEDGAHVKAAVESVLEFSEVAVSVLGELDRMLGAGDGRIQVALRGADGVEARVGRLRVAVADHDAVVDPGLGHYIEASQTIGDQRQAARC